MKCAAALRPPKHLTAAASAAWLVLVPKLLAAGLFIPSIDGLALEVFAQTWADYRRASRSLQRAATTADRRLFRQLRDEWRLETRRWAAKFLLIPENRVALARLSIDGEDLELMRIFTPGAPLPRAPLSADDRRNLDGWNRRAVEAGLLMPKERSHR